MTFSAAAYLETGAIPEASWLPASHTLLDIALCYCLIGLTLTYSQRRALGSLYRQRNHSAFPPYDFSDSGLKKLHGLDTPSLRTVYRRARVYATTVNTPSKAVVFTRLAETAMNLLLWRSEETAAGMTSIGLPISKHSS